MIKTVNVLRGRSTREYLLDGWEVTLKVLCEAGGPGIKMDIFDRLCAKWPDILSVWLCYAERLNPLLDPATRASVVFEVDGAAEKYHPRISCISAGMHVLCHAPVDVATMGDLFAHHRKVRKLEQAVDKYGFPGVMIDRVTKAILKTRKEVVS